MVIKLAEGKHVWKGRLVEKPELTINENIPGLLKGIPFSAKLQEASTCNI